MRGRLAGMTTYLPEPMSLMTESDRSEKSWGIFGALALEKALRPAESGSDGSVLCRSGGELDDAIPALGGADDAADVEPAGGEQGVGHGLVGADHELLDELGGAVVEAFFEAFDLTIDDERIGLDTAELDGSLAARSARRRWAAWSWRRSWA